MIFFDNNSTTQPDEEMLERACQLVCKDFANPSSTHRMGENANGLLEDARRKVADSLGCDAGEIVFTSGGTESNGIILHRKNHGTSVIDPFVICSRTEHNSVSCYCTEQFDVNQDGTYNLASLESLIKCVRNVSYDASAKYRSIVVAVSLVNNETGVIPFIGDEVWDICQKYNCHLHIDAVAAYGKIPINVGSTGWHNSKYAERRLVKCHSMSVSAHKVHGLKGIGALFISKTSPIRKIYHPLCGGPHEFAVRAGTQNILGAVHFGLVIDGWSKKQKVNGEFRDYFEGLLSDIAEVNGKRDQRVHNTSSLYFPAVKDLDLFLHDLSENGLMVSGKSACSSGLPSPSKVLSAMYGGGSPRLSGSIRVSLSDFNLKGQLDHAAEIIRKVIAS